MAIIGNNADTLLQGLSDFWTTYFKEVGDIQAIYEGTEIVLGQHYLNLCNDVLNVNIDTTPLFKKEYYKLLVIREDQLTYTPSTSTLRYQPDVYVVDAPSLQNKVYDPTAAYDNNIEYTIVNGGLEFINDPFVGSNSDGFAKKQLSVAVAGYFTAPTLGSLGIQRGDVVKIYTTPGLESTLVTSLNVVYVDNTNNKVAISLSTPLPAHTPSSWTTHAWKVYREGSLFLDRSTGFTLITMDGSLIYDQTLVVQALSFWLVDAKVDDYRLYETFGYLFGDKKLSTEIYRGFIKGVMQLYILGPAIKRIESALNVIAGFPVIRDDGEVLQDFVIGTATHTVVTDKNSYVYPLDIPIRDDVVDPANFGILSFESFEPLTTAISVDDTMTDTEWWTDTAIPEKLWPEESLARRTISAVLYDNVIGDNNGGWCVGDPDGYIGANDLGEISDVLVHHQAAFVLMNKYLQTHLFKVSIVPEVDLTGALISQMQQLLLEAKPVHTDVYFVPYTKFEETLIVEEDALAMTPTLHLDDLITTVDNSLVIGADDLYIGDELGYTSLTGETVDPGGTGILLMIGGTNPYIEGPGFTDKSLSVNVV